MEKITINQLHGFSTSTTLVGNFGNGYCRKIELRSEIDRNGNTSTTFHVYRNELGGRLNQSVDTLEEALEIYNNIY